MQALSLYLIKEEIVVTEENSRRKFLANAGKTTVAVAAGSSILASNALGESHSESRSSVVKGSSKKEEILYQKTAEWERYYKRAY